MLLHFKLYTLNDIKQSVYIIIDLEKIITLKLLILLNGLLGFLRKCYSDIFFRMYYIYVCDVTSVTSHSIIVIAPLKNKNVKYCHES